MSERFEQRLAHSGLGVEVRRFPAGTRTAEDAARAIGCEVGQIVKSLVFTLEGEPVVLLVSGANRVEPGRFEGRLAKADAGRGFGRDGTSSRPPGRGVGRPSRIRQQDPLLLLGRMSSGDGQPVG